VHQPRDRVEQFAVFASNTHAATDQLFDTAGVAAPVVRQHIPSVAVRDPSVHLQQVRTDLVIHDSGVFKEEAMVP